MRYRIRRTLPVLPFVLALTSAGLGQQCEEELLASDGAAYDFFGGAAIFGSLPPIPGGPIAIDGDTLLVAAPWHDDGADAAGAVYVFERQGNAWIETAKLTASDAAPSDSFGFSVDLDGDTAVVGAVFDDDVGPETGSVYVFERTPAGWVETTEVHASDSVSFDWFGTSVSISGDRFLVGAMQQSALATSSGSAYVFDRTPAGWTETTKLVAADGAAGDNFGVDVALDGDAALIGAWRHGDLGTWAGSAYAFDLTPNGWAQTQELSPASVAAGHQFGIAVALDGDRALVSADRVGTDGVAYVFERNANVWTEDAALVAPDAAPGDWFGFSLALSGDRALVGAFGAFTVQHGAGAVYLFERGPSAWIASDKLVPSDAALGDGFGIAVALDGSVAVAGAPWHDQLADEAGAAYAIELVCEIGTDYCGPAVPNSTGVPGTIAAFGSDVAADDDVTLEAADLPPNQFGYFLNSRTQGFVFMVPNSQGALCLGAGIGRYVAQVGNTGNTGTLSLELDLTQTPTPAGAVSVMAGETWNFTCWHRDDNPGPTSNFTDGVSILFL